MYLQILTAIFVILIVANLVIQQRLGVGIIGLLVFGYLLVALYAARKIRTLSAGNLASDDAAHQEGIQTAIASKGRSQTLAAIAIIVAAALIAAALYFAKSGTQPRSNPIQAVKEGVAGQGNTTDEQEERKLIVQKCAQRVEEIRQAAQKDSADCHFKALKILSDNPDGSDEVAEVFNQSCEEKKLTITEEEQLMKRCLRQNGIE